MAEALTQQQVLAFAVYELRLLLASHLESPSPELKAAARLSYMLHNQALAILEGRSFDPVAATETIAHLDQVLGENFMQQLTKLTKRAV